MEVVTIYRGQRSPKPTGPEIEIRVIGDGVRVTARRHAQRVREVRSRYISFCLEPRGSHQTDPFAAQDSAAEEGTE
jgi:hypothetical protein